MKKGYLTFNDPFQGKKFNNSFLIILVFSLLSISSTWAQDADGDGISDADECAANTTIVDVFGDAGAFAQSGYPITASVTGLAASSGVDVFNYNVQLVLGTGDIYENCQLDFYTDDVTAFFDDGLQLTIDGNLLLFFDQNHWDNTRPAGAATTEFNAGGRFDTDLNGLWEPWNNEGNPQLVVVNNTIQLMVDVVGGGPREDALPFMDSSINVTGAFVVSNAFTYDCLAGVSVDFGNVNHGGSGAIAAHKMDVSVFVCIDTDGDGIVDKDDEDSDNDGILDIVEGNVDTDSDGKPDYIDNDSDNDGCPDALEGAAGYTSTDIDNLGRLLAVVNGVGVPGGASQGTTAGVLDDSVIAVACDTDGDGIPPISDLDDDNDGIPDTDETCDAPFAFDEPVGPSSVNSNFNDVGTVVFDFEYTDNSINLEIGGVRLHPRDIELESALYVPATDVQLLFVDNTGYPTLLHEVHEPWDVNFNGLPRFRVIVDGLGNVELWGTRETTSQFMERLETSDGSPFNAINFVPGITNIVVENIADGGLEAMKGTVTVYCDNDGDGIPDYLDLDSDNDGILDATEGSTDTDGDGVLDRLDLDSDNDGIVDIIEAGGVDTDGDGVADGFADVDLNGLDDTIEATPLLVPNTDGDGNPNYLDLDSDDDGIPDNIEGQTTLGYNAPLVGDSDNDGINDAYDLDAGGTPIDPVNSDADVNPDYIDTDSDNDNLGDTLEAGITLGPNDFDSDGLNDAVDADLTGYDDPGGTIDDPLSGAVILPDTDGDVNTGGDVDYRDALDNDNDGIDDIADLDSDNDGIPDIIESGGVDPYTDGDGDGVPLYLDDNDADGATGDVDGLIQAGFDIDGDGVPNHLDLDSDNDGIFDIVESDQIDAANNVVDLDNNGRIDGATPLGVGTNGLYDPLEDAPDSGVLADLTADSDADGTPDSNEIDADNDGCFDVFEAGFTDGDTNGLLGNGTFGIGLTVDANGVVTSGVDGYTTPDDLDSNGTYDFQELGQAVSLTTQPVGQTIIIGSTANFDITGAAAVYQWQESTDGGGTWANISNGGSNPTYSGATTDEITISSVPSTYDGYQYRVILSSPAFACDGNITSAAATLNLFSDYDGDGIPDVTDLDDDNDGIPDTDESGGLDPNADADGDGVPAYLDDNDGDAGIGNDDGLFQPGFDIDGDGVPNHLDLDSDNDGIFDIVESGQIDAANNVVDVNNDGIIDAANNGTVGANGVFDPLESAPDSGTLANASADSDSDGIPDSNEIDADNDGCFDVFEAGFTDGDNNGFLGNGTFGAGLTVNPNGVVTSGVDGYTTPDDQDSNGIYDFQELGEAVTLTTQPVGQTIVIGSTANFDITGSAAVYQWQESTDGGGTWANVSDGGANPTYAGTATDEITISNVPVTYNGYQYRVILSSPAFACDGNITSAAATLNLFNDNDGDGIPDVTDLDDDNDGIPDTIEGAGDDDGDGIPNAFDLDSDNDGIYDIVESGQIDAANNVVDLDNDGRIDGATPLGVGTNGLYDPLEDAPDSGVLTNLTADSDADGIPDSNEINSDNDGCNDVIEAGFTDGDDNGLLGNGTFGVGLTVDANGVVTSGVDGYTVPDDGDSNGVYDFQEVGQAVSIATQPTDQTVILNANANFDVTGTSPVYQWQESTNSGGTWTNLVNGGIYSGVDTATLTINANSLTLDGNQYRVILSSPAYACDGNITSNAATLTVLTDNDGDGIPDVIDLDDDNDGILDSVEGTGDLDGDGIPNHFDLDADGDGVYDTNEAGFADLDADNDGVIDGVPADFGANGLFDGIESDDTGAATVTYTLLNTDGDANPNFLDVDDDNDGVNTLYENANPDGDMDPSDAQDTDNDGTADYLDVDDDGDGVNTEFEVSNADADGNPNTGVAVLNTDGDLLPDYLDLDDDNDGVHTMYEVDNTDGDGNPNTGVTMDTDSDGTLDYLDDDDDGDSILTRFENPDPNGDGNPDDAQDSDSDGEPDYLDVDDDGDGVYTIFENPDVNNDGNPSDAQDTDGDGTLDYLDIDDDNDTILTIDENPDPNGDGNPADAQDTDGDTIPDYLDADDDNDGILTVDEDIDGNGDPRDDDSDGDGRPNYLDIDDDGDGILTLTEGPGDQDTDGLPNYLDQDADADGIPDNVEGQGTANYIAPSGLDADLDGLDDAYEVVTANGGIVPVNTDGADNPDYLDNDSDNDNVPDSTEGHDFNADGEEDIFPSGNDTDMDGLDDAYDGSVGDFADPNGLTVVNDPGTDLPNRDEGYPSSTNPAALPEDVDYRDNDDDNDGILTIDEDGDEDGDPRNDNCDEDPYPDYLDRTRCDLVPTGFSPNGDGLNDTFVVPDLAQYANFEMEVYDRWGNLVYEYANNGRAQPIWWDGFSSGPRTINKKKKVPVGTYYFIIRYNDRGTPPLAKWVYVNY